MMNVVMSGSNVVVNQCADGISNWRLCRGD